MAFDEGLAERIRDLVQVRGAITERRMFGGLAFMSHGRMFVGVIGDTLMARVGQAEYAGALARRHVREMDFTGKSMKGYVYVDASGLEEESDLKHWVDACLRYVETLPLKSPKRRCHPLRWQAPRAEV